MDSETLSGKSAVISGASRGIGKSIALSLARSGADLCLIGRDGEGLGRTRDQAVDMGRQCHLLKADLSDPEETRLAGHKILDIRKSWDILVNNAGTASNAPLLDITGEEWKRVHGVNLMAPLFLAQALVPGMIRHGGGKIINISSMTTFMGTPNSGAYAASKAGLNQLTKTMAVEWGGHNIQANAVCPTVVRTKLAEKVMEDPQKAGIFKTIKKRIPLGRFAETRDVADLVVFLAGPGSDFLNGCILPLDGGYRLNPA